MMLFLARSALCIGAVAAAGAGVGVGEISGVLDRGTRAAVEGAGRSCLASAGCLRAGLTALEGTGLRTSGPRETAPAPRKPGGPVRLPADRHR